MIPLRKIERYRRLQIGGIGLAAVLLMVGLANILTDRPTEDRPVVVTDQEGNVRILTDKEAAQPSEPLNELGVQPAPASDKTDPVAPSQQRPARNRAVSNNGALPAPVEPGERVPDLQPATRSR